MGIGRRRYYQWNRLEKTFRASWVLELLRIFFCCQNNYPRNQETDANKLDIQIDNTKEQKFPEIVIKQGGSENELLSDVKIPGAIKVNLTFQVQIPKIPENIDQLVSDITNTFSEMADN